MQIFLDSLCIQNILKYKDIISGITTNPVIIAKFLSNKINEFECEKMSLNFCKIERCEELSYNFPYHNNFIYKELTSIQQISSDFLIHLQVCGRDATTMIAEALEFSKIGPNIIVKVPLNYEGFKAIKEIVKIGIKVNGTLCFSLMQARVAQDYGATYVSPFIGRMQDAGIDIEKFMNDLSSIMKHTKILASSVRNLKSIELAACTSHAITINETVLEQFFEMPLLKQGELLFKNAMKS